MGVLPLRLASTFGVGEGPVRPRGAPAVPPVRVAPDFPGGGTVAGAPAPAAAPRVTLLLVDGLTPADLAAFPALRGRAALALVNVLTASPDTPAAAAATLGAGTRARPPAAGEAGLGYQVDLGWLGQAARRAGTCASAAGGATARLVTPTAGSEPACRLRVIADDAVAAAQGPTARHAALLATGRQIAGLLARLRPSDLLIVVSPWVPPGRPPLHLAPLWLAGDGPGLVYSPSTRTPGFATLPDVTATVAARLGVAVGPPVLGRPLRVAAIADSLARLRARFVSLWAARLRRDPLLTLGAVLVIGAVALRRRLLLLAATALPLGYLALAGAPTASPAPAAALVLGTITLLAGLAGRLERRRAGAGFGALAAAGAVAILLDLARGGPWMAASPLGFSPNAGARFYGLGNEYAGALLGAALVAVGEFADQMARPGALFAATGVLIAVATGVLGANFGAMLAAATGWCAALALLGPVPRRVWGAIAGAVALAVAWNLHTGSHLALAARVVATGGPSAAAGIILRKLALNARLIATQARGLLLFGALLAYFALAWRRARGSLAERPGLAGALTGCAAGAAANLLLNDSGVVAAATTALYGACALLATRGREEGAGGEPNHPHCEVRKGNRRGGE